MDSSFWANIIAIIVFVASAVWTVARIKTTTRILEERVSTLMCLISALADQMKEFDQKLDEQSERLFHLEVRFDDSARPRR